MLLYIYIVSFLVFSFTQLIFHVVIFTRVIPVAGTSIFHSLSWATWLTNLNSVTIFIATFSGIDYFCRL